MFLLLSIEITTPSLVPEGAAILTKATNCQKYYRVVLFHRSRLVYYTFITSARIQNLAALCYMAVQRYLSLYEISNIFSAVYRPILLISLRPIGRLEGRIEKGLGSPLQLLLQGTFL